MSGMNATTGQEIDGLEHLKQSIRDILTTGIGERVMRRGYGSQLPDLVDAPINRLTLAALYAATAGALRRWEPRFHLAQITVTTVAAGRIALEVAGEYLPDGLPMSVAVEVAQ